MSVLDDLERVFADGPAVGLYNRRHQATRSAAIPAAWAP